MSAASRMLISELDSPAQRDRFTGDARQAITELTGMLRIAMLISGEVLVTDAMLLDGEYFMTLGPAGVLRELGGSQSRYPLVVTGRHDSLRAGLDARLADHDFLWSLRRPPAGDDIPADVRQTWDDWLRYVDQGLIRYERQDGPLAPMPIGAARVPTPDHLQQLRDANLGEIRRRSTALAVIDALPWNDADRDGVRRWWNDAYLRLIAESAAADWVSFESRAKHAPIRRTGDVDLEVSAALMTWARESNPTTIAVAWDATARQRDDLQAKPTRWRMRNLAFSATQVSSAPSRPGILLGSALKLFAAAAVVALALPVLQIGGADNPWTWVAFAAAIATTVPFDALKALIALIKPDRRVILVLHREGRS
ncbi:hypothetical protein [Microbacterium sp. WCS2018Hpa-23]|uniref:hypothetical protein n=1 Tax=Microbacterium sp. WCS2018Hpa-23 TaxID=3073634 RepID=UPI0028831D44|nr:hypothetical protein [Microbacterium sp. WCS2018Hpa-23]